MRDWKGRVSEAGWRSYAHLSCRAPSQSLVGSPIILSLLSVIGLLSSNVENGANHGEENMNDNVVLPSSLPDKVVGDFYIQPLPEAWKECIQEIVPTVSSILWGWEAYLAGGFLRSLVSEDSVGPATTDIDLFFRDGGEYYSVKNHLLAHDDFEMTFQCPTDKLATFRHRPTAWKYQCIAFDFYPSLYHVVESFDFTATCFGTDGESLIFHKSAVSDTVEKILRWNKITYPASSMRRMMKYARKGFTMSEKEYQHFLHCVATNHSDIRDMSLVYID